MIRGGARGGDRVRRSMNPKFERNPTGTCICHRAWNGQWRNTWVSFPIKPLISFFFGKLSPDTASRNHRRAVGEVSLEAQPALGDRFASRDCRELGKALQHDQIFVAEVIGWIEAPGLSAVLEL